MISAHKGALLFAAIVGALQASTTQVSASVADRTAVEEAMRRANGYFQSNFPLGTAVWDRSAYHTGNVRAWETLGFQTDYERSVSWGEANSWLRGPEGATHADAHCCGQSYIDLHGIDPQPVRIENITETMDALLADPSSVDDWWWIDAFYMAGPTLARLAVISDDTDYLDQLLAMYEHMKTVRGLFDSARGIWWRDGGFHGSDIYWGRGNGWVIAACARVLEQLPEDDTAYRPEFESMLQTMAAALLPWQQPDGFWRASIIDPNNPSFDNPETSGTAFFTYGIAYGLNEGIISDAPGTDYSAAVLDAWNGMVSIALHDSGKLGYVQSIGSDPQPADHQNDRDYGYGAFLLAGSEILQMMGGPAPVSADAGPDVQRIDTDGDYVESVTLDASDSIVRSSSIAGWSWWLGPTLLGSGERTTVDFPLGTAEVTLKIQDAEGNTYTDMLAVTISPLPPVEIAEVTAIGYQHPNAPSNTLDGSLETRWSQFGLNQWIQYSLSAPIWLDHIDAAFYLGDERNAMIDIELSLDGSQWTNVFSGSSSGTTSGLEAFAFPGQSVRHIRIVGQGNSQSDWNSITEVALIPLVNDQTDSDANGLPDSWEIHHFGATGQDSSAIIAGKSITIRDAWILGVDPHDPHASPLLRIEGRPPALPILHLDSRAAFGAGYVGLTRMLRILSSNTLAADSWVPLAGYEEIIGDNIPREMPVDPSARFYRVETWLE